VYQASAGDGSSETWQCKQRYAAGVSQLVTCTLARAGQREALARAGQREALARAGQREALARAGQREALARAGQREAPEMWDAPRARRLCVCGFSGDQRVGASFAGTRIKKTNSNLQDSEFRHEDLSVNDKRQLRRTRKPNTAKN
jgi:hypothetical protein